jgi:hypothetical protein
MQPDRARRIYSDIDYYGHHWQSAASFVLHLCRVRVPPSKDIDRLYTG